MSSDQAFGGPGKVPHWEHADKDGVGAGFTNANRVWFTLWRGSVTEVYFPHVDRAQVRNLQLVVTDGQSFVHCESDDFDCNVTRINETSQAYRVSGKALEANYRIEKEVICDPDVPCVTQRYRIVSEHDRPLRAYVVCNPHMEGQGTGGNAKVAEINGKTVLLAHQNAHWLALGCSPGFARASVGFAGESDGVTDLQEHRRMEYQFTEALDGNVVLTGEIPAGAGEFTVMLAFGDADHAALTALVQASAAEFDQKRDKYIKQWDAACQRRLDLRPATEDDGRLYEISCNTLCTHEDRIYSGALIASLAIPWGQVRRALTPARAGYHLVWPRDAVNCAGAMLASGDRDTPLRTLTYLSVSQRADGSFAQNFWINGKPNWLGLQLDEVTYPVLLARHLHREKALVDFNPLPMVYKAAEYIVHQGPITPQERWEQMSGYSPSTIAIVIASMLCAAAFAREDGKPAAAAFLEDYADWMRNHIEVWTVTTSGDLLPGCPRYVIRINPAEPGDGEPDSPNNAMLKLPDQPPGAPEQYPARNIVDAGFLELVRYGIWKPDMPLVVDTLKVVDATIKVETPLGPCWRRFNHDGYGQRDDGSPYQGWGNGRAWPLLTGERGHYALLAGEDAKAYIAAMERFANSTGLLPEQVWDVPFHKRGKNYLGRPTGSANPLAWAHAEYIKLVRSQADGRVFDMFPEVEDRYAKEDSHREHFTMWTLNYPSRTTAPGEILRIYARCPFMLRYSLDDWSNSQDVSATPTELPIHFVDIRVAAEQKAPIRFTFLWTGTDKWNGCDYAVSVTPR